MTDKLQLPVAGLPKVRVVEFICGSSCTSWSRVESWCLTSSEVSEVSFCGVLPLLLLTARLSCHTSRLTAIRPSKQHQNKAGQSDDNDNIDTGKTCWTFREKAKKKTVRVLRWVSQLRQVRKGKLTAGTKVKKNWKDLISLKAGRKNWGYCDFNRDGFFFMKKRICWKLLKLNESR